MEELVRPVVGEVASFPIYPTPPSSSFPVTQNAFQSSFNQGSTDPLAGSTDGFLTKLNPSGSALIFSTFLGGGVEDSAAGVKLDPAGRICVVGETSSTDFPVTNAAQSILAGGTNFNVTGALYFPKNDVNFAGGSSTGSNCTQLIANTITLSGGSQFNSTCTSAGTKTIAYTNGTLTM